MSEWISCTERLPQKENEHQRRGFYLTTNECGSVGVTRYEFFDDFHGTGWQSDFEIKAWQPLPKAYEGE